MQCTKNKNDGHEYELLRTPPAHVFVCIQHYLHSLLQTFALQHELQHSRRRHIAHGQMFN